MHWPRYLLLLLLLLPISSAINISPVDFTFAVPAVAIIVIAMLAGISMLATSISNPQLEAWAKTEIREFVFGIVLIALIVAFFVSTTGISLALTGTTNFVKTATDTLDSWLTQYDGSYTYIIQAATRIRVAATYAPYINIPLWYVSISYSTNPLAGIAVLFQTLTMATQGLTNAIYLAEAVRLLIVFSQVVGKPILLPLAFVVRLIPFTRKLGNTLIALAIGVMVFLPFSVIAASALNSTIVMPNPKIGDLGALNPDPWAMVAVEPLCQNEFIRTMLGLTDPLFALVVCLPFYLVPIVGPALFAACFSLVQYVIYPLITEIMQLIMAVLLLAWEIKTEIANATGNGYGPQVYDQLQPFLDSLDSLIVMAYLDFIFIMLITITGARALSTALGGEWYMAGIQRLI